MSSVILGADTPAIEDRCPRTAARPALRAKEGASLLRRAQGLAAGILFLAVRAPIYVGVMLFGALISLVGVVLYGIQAIGLRLTRPTGAAAAAALALVCIAGPQRARADAITDTSLLQQTTLVFGTSQTNLYSFDAPSAGTLSISLKDWQFPVPLNQLTASIMSQDNVIGPSYDSSTGSDPSFDVQIQAGGLFAAFVAAEAGTYQGFPFGAYSLNIQFEPTATPVPLPPALDLLLTGMGLLGAVTLVERISRRRNRDVMSIA